MKKISRRSFVTAMAAVSAAGVLAACGSSSSSTASSVASSAVSSEATSSAASMDETGTHTVVDHGGNEVEVPNILQSACHTGYFGCNQRHLCGCNSCYYPVLQYSGNAAHRLGLWPDFRLFYSESRRQE